MEAGRAQASTISADTAHSRRRPTLAPTQQLLLHRAGGMSYAESRLFLSPGGGAQRALEPTAAGATSVAMSGFAGGGGAVPYKSEMESAFGADFSAVQAYSGPAASQASAALGANAYAYGNAIAFADSAPSKHLVAHELTHVIQQGGAGSSMVQTKASGGGSVGTLEAEADHVASVIAGGGTLADAGPITVGAGQAIARDEADEWMSYPTDEQPGVNWVPPMSLPPQHDQTYGPEDDVECGLGGPTDAEATALPEEDYNPTSHDEDQRFFEETGPSGYGAMSFDRARGDDVEVREDMTLSGEQGQDWQYAEGGQSRYGGGVRYDEGELSAEGEMTRLSESGNRTHVRAHAGTDGFGGGGSYQDASGAGAGADFRVNEDGGAMSWEYTGRRQDDGSQFQMGGGGYHYTDEDGNQSTGGGFNARVQGEDQTFAQGGFVWGYGVDEHGNPIESYSSVNFGLMGRALTLSSGWYIEITEPEQISVDPERWQVTARRVAESTQELDRSFRRGGNSFGVSFQNQRTEASWRTFVFPDRPTAVGFCERPDLPETGMPEGALEASEELGIGESAGHSEETERTYGASLSWSRIRLGVDVSFGRDESVRVTRVGDTALQLDARVTRARGLALGLGAGALDIDLGRGTDRMERLVVRVDATSQAGQELFDMLAEDVAEGMEWFLDEYESGMRFAGIELETHVNETDRERTTGIELGSLEFGMTNGVTEFEGIDNGELVAGDAGYGEDSFGDGYERQARFDGADYFDAETGNYNRSTYTLTETLDIDDADEACLALAGATDTVCRTDFVDGDTSHEWTVETVIDPDAMHDLIDYINADDYRSHRLEYAGYTGFGSEIERMIASIDAHPTHNGAREAIAVMLRSVGPTGAEIMRHLIRQVAGEGAMTMDIVVDGRSLPGTTGAEERFEAQLGRLDAQIADYTLDPAAIATELGELIAEQNQWLQDLDDEVYPELNSGLEQRVRRAVEANLQALEDAGVRLGERAQFEADTGGMSGVGGPMSVEPGDGGGFDLTGATERLTTIGDEITALKEGMCVRGGRRYQAELAYRVMIHGFELRAPAHESPYEAWGEGSLSRSFEAGREGYEDGNSRWADADEHFAAFRDARATFATDAALHLDDLAGAEALLEEIRALGRQAHAAYTEARSAYARCLRNFNAIYEAYSDRTDHLHAYETGILPDDWM